MKSILFLLKQRQNYGGSYTPSFRTGLYNSARITASRLEGEFKTDLEVCVDGNEIDKFVHKYKPTYCIIEALWATPTKLLELKKLHPKTKFIVRIHSNTPFLANEGISVKWLKEYTQFGIKVAFNSPSACEDFDALGVDSIYLPNIYDKVLISHTLGYEDTIFKLVSKVLKPEHLVGLCGRTIDIGCFGAIRPLKNQLFQAIAAIGFADRVGAKLRYHINAGRVEQKGESVLKNIRAAFAETEHELVEHEWLDHSEFLELVKTMDVGLQLSFTETFNIVSADFVRKGVPVIVSKDINWIGDQLIVDHLDMTQVIDKIAQAFFFRDYLRRVARKNLNKYNRTSIEVWKDVL